MTTIYARAQDQVLTATILPKLACNNRKSVKLHVDFDAKWAEYAKSALFYTDKDPTVYPEVLSSGECTIPHEVLAEAGRLFITIQGINSSTGQLKSTTPISYKILPGTPSLVVSDPSPSVYQKLLEAWVENESRISNIIAHNNDTDGNTELIDAHKGLYDEVHATIGDAMRYMGDTFMKAMTEKSLVECLKIRQAYYYLGSTSIDTNAVDSCLMRSKLVDLEAYQAALATYGTKDGSPYAVVGELNSPLPVSTDFSGHLLVVKSDVAASVAIRFSSGLSWSGSETVTGLYTNLSKGINIIPLNVTNATNNGHASFKYVSLQTTALANATQFDAYIVTDSMLVDYFANKVDDLRHDLFYVDLDKDPEAYAKNLECNVTYSDSLLKINIPEKTTTEAEWRFAIVSINLGKDIAGKKLLVRRNTNNMKSFGIGVSASQWAAKNFSTDHEIHEIDLDEFIAENVTLAANNGDYYLIIGIEVANTSTYNREYNESVNIMEIVGASESLSPLARLGKFDPEDYVRKDENNYVVCWGDSLTAGGGWTERLASLSKLPVHNAGTGGENARTIMARQGADPIIVNNITIPANRVPVTIATYASPLTTAFGYNATPLLQGGGLHVNPVKIGDIEGTLTWTGNSYNDTNGTWTFTRSQTGAAVTINRPTAMTTAFDREKNSPHLMIIFMGQNGGYDANNDELVRMHQLMINHANAKHTIILGLSSGSASSRANYENAMKKAFGRYFISLREYLSTYGLADAGLTPTTADNMAMAVGTVPQQLLVDSVHYTNATKTVIGNLIYKRCCELGIFK